MTIAAGAPRRTQPHTGWFETSPYRSGREFIITGPGEPGAPIRDAEPGRVFRKRDWHAGRAQLDGQELDAHGHGYVNDLAGSGQLAGFGVSAELDDSVGAFVSHQHDLPAGWILKPLGVSPRVDSCPTKVIFPLESSNVNIARL